MADDVVAELDAWLNRNPMTDRVLTLAALVQRARDEIAALRAMREAHIRMLSAKLDEDDENMRRWIAKARAEALEEAARVADGYCTDRTDDVARGIRALKEKGDE